MALSFSKPSSDRRVCSVLLKMLAMTKLTEFSLLFNLLQDNPPYHRRKIPFSVKNVTGLSRLPQFRILHSG